MPNTFLLIPTGRSETLWDVKPDFVMRLDTDGTWPSTHPNDWGSLVWRITANVFGRDDVTICVGIVDHEDRYELEALTALIPQVEASVARMCANSDVIQTDVRWVALYLKATGLVSVGSVTPGVEFTFPGRNQGYVVLNDQTGLVGNTIKIGQVRGRGTQVVQRWAAVRLVEPNAILKA